MKTRLYLLVLGLLASLAMTASSAQEKKGKGGKEKGTKDAKEAKVLQPDTEAQENAEKMIAAFKLREWAKGKQVSKKAPPVGWSIEVMLAAAELFRTIPPPQKLDVAVEAGKEKDAPERTDAKLQEAEPFEPKKEALKTLEEAKKLLELVDDPKKKDFYQAQIADMESKTGTKDVLGGPRTVQRAILPGQYHSYQFQWEAHKPGKVAFQSNVPMRLQVVQDAGGYVVSDAVTTAATPNFMPGGPGTPAANKTISVTIRVVNVSKAPTSYVLGVQ